jgi:hypothetical protein
MTKNLRVTVPIPFTLDVTSTTLVHGIEFGVQLFEAPAPLELIGHAWVQDEVSRTVFGVVARGSTLENLQKNIAEDLAEITEYCRDEIKVEPVLVGRGWDPQNPPRV